MSEVVAYGLLLVLGAVVGLVVYEALTRFAIPKNRMAPIGGQSVREGLFHRFGVQGDSSHRPFNTVLVTLAEILEQFAPLARSESTACRDSLERAGLSLSPGTWRSLRVLSAVLVGFVVGALLTGFVPVPLGVGVVLVGVGIGIGWALPKLILSSRAQSRKLAIEASLPDAMELLGIAIAAGSPVEQCFREVAVSMEGPLSEELSLVDQEVNLLGHARETALENLGKRCGSSEVSAFVAQLTQAVSQGTSIAESLTNQAKLSRDMMQADALERIRKMPTKLDVVLSLCFLPPTVALVVVPTVVKLLQFLNDTMT